MITELVAFAILFVFISSLACWLTEDETLLEYSERRAVNRLADESMKHKPQGMRPRCRYIRAGVQK
jgi:hypothetical protein